MNPNFTNFWPGFCFDVDVASHRFLVAGLAHHAITIGSVFGRSTEIFDVLISGECLQSIHWEEDHFSWEDGRGGGRARWFVGVPRIDHPQALWQPFFYFYWADYRDRRNVALQSLWQNKKEFGVSVVMSNSSWGSLARKRFDLAHALSHYVPVHASAAMQFGAPSDSQVTYHDVAPGYEGKLRFISRFTHHLCFENETFPGYLTEKLFDSLFVGSVPLYAGDPQAGVWFEPESFVDCINLSVQEIASAIEERVHILKQVSRQRETLCLVSFEEMERQTMAFHRRALLE